MTARVFHFNPREGDSLATKRGGWGAEPVSHRNMRINPKTYLPALVILVLVSSPKNVTQGASSFEIHETFSLK